MVLLQRERERLSEYAWRFIHGYMHFYFFFSLRVGFLFFFSKNCWPLLIVLLYTILLLLEFSRKKDSFSLSLLSFPHTKSGKRCVAIASLRQISSFVEIIFLGDVHSESEWKAEIVEGVFTVQVGISPLSRFYNNLCTFFLTINIEF